MYKSLMVYKMLFVHNQNNFFFFFVFLLRREVGPKIPFIFGIGK